MAHKDDFLFYLDRSKNPNERLKNYVMNNFGGDHVLKLEKFDRSVYKELKFRGLLEQIVDENGIIKKLQAGKESEENIPTENPLVHKKKTVKEEFDYSPKKDGDVRDFIRKHCKGWSRTMIYQKFPNAHRSCKESGYFSELMEEGTVPYFGRNSVPETRSVGKNTASELAQGGLESKCGLQEKTFLGNKNRSCIYTERIRDVGKPNVPLGYFKNIAIATDFARKHCRGFSPVELFNYSQPLYHMLRMHKKIKELVEEGVIRYKIRGKNARNFT